jgi:flagella basal body P-ring formation protein FlgA
MPAAMLAQEAGSMELLGLQALVFAENSAANMPGEYTFQISHPPKLPPLKPGKLSFEAQRLSKDDPVGRFFIVFRVFLDGRQATTMRVDLEGIWSGSLYQAKNALQRKSVITEDDFDLIPFEGVPPSGAVKMLPDNVRLRQPLIMGKILTHADIELIPLINATDRVRVTIKNGPLQITSSATARSNGAKGGRVRLEMDGSQKIVQGIVTGPCEAVLDVKGSAAR